MEVKYCVQCGNPAFKRSEKGELSCIQCGLEYKKVSVNELNVMPIGYMPVKIELPKPKAKWWQFK